MNISILLQTFANFNYHPVVGLKERKKTMYVTVLPIIAVYLIFLNEDGLFYLIKREDFPQGKKSASSKNRNASYF